jgi:RNA polymerase sigma factor (sigma-70 family)
MASDTRLVSASLVGDRRAFEHIVRRYQSLVCAVTYSATGDLSASEDLAQETFIAAWRKLESLREPSRLRPWLCTIARNLSADWLRSRRRDVVAGAVPLDEAGQVEAAAQTPHERAAASERGSLVWGALSEMPEAYRMPLVLYYREQQSVRRVAQSLELSEEAVRQRLTRGRGMLKERMTALVEETLTATRPGDAFCAAVVAAALGAAAKKAAAGTTILGLSLAKAAAIGAIVVGAAVGGGVALQHLGAGGGPREQTPAAVAVEAPEPQPAVVYAERMPKQAVVVTEADLKPFFAMVSAIMRSLGQEAPPALDVLLSETCFTTDPSTVEPRLWGVSLEPKYLGPSTTIFRLADANRYLASLLPELSKDGEEGGLHVYTRTRTKQTLLVDTAGRWAAVSSDLAEVRVVMQMVKAGEFPAQRVFPDAAVGTAFRLAGLSETTWGRPDSPFNVLRQGLGIRTAPGAKAPPGSWAALIGAAEGLASRQVDTLAFAVGGSENGLWCKVQLQPVAGTPLAARFGAKRPGGLGLLKYVPADSLAVLDSQLPDLSGLLPAQDPAPLPVRALRLLGDEAALALGRSPKGSAQLVLAARVKDAKAVQALADDLAALLIPYLANLRPDQPDLPFRLNRSEVVHNGHLVKVWDFDPNPPPPGARPSTLLTLLGEDLKLYEFTVGDVLILAFGDGMFEKVKQMLDGSLADLSRSARFTEAMAAMPAQPNAVCYAEAEKLAAWLVDIVPGPAQLKELKFQDGPPAVLAGHVIGRDVLEAAVRLPFGALRAFVQVQKALTPPRAVPPAPPVALPPQPLPPAPQPAPLAPLHGAASAGNRAEVERLLAGGADVNARSPDGRTPLHYAAEQGSLEIVQLLLAKGADVNAEDARRRAPLHLAAQGGHREVAEALLKAGAGVNATDFDGWTPTGYAVRARHQDLADLLARSGGVE